MNKQEKEAYQYSSNLFNNCCALCGSPYIQLHHIRYGACGRKTYIGNIIPLCKKHHDLVHTNKRKYMPMLIDIIDKKLGEKNEL